MGGHSNTRRTWANTADVKELGTIKKLILQIRYYFRSNQTGSQTQEWHGESGHFSK